jgi:protein O-mannosyl-transferase
MKKSKRLRQAEAAGSNKAAGKPQSSPKKFVWWPWVAGLAGLLLAFGIYGPALSGPFVLDDLYYPFGNKALQGLAFRPWINGTRPILMISFWLNHHFSGDDPDSYHATNVFLHVLVAVLVALIAMRLVEWASAAWAGAESGRGNHAVQRAKPGVGIFAGALFLVHPLQTESVAYVSSRSEVLSVLFYYAAYCVFLYRRTESITWPRALAVLALFGLAIGSKEHTLTLPLLLLLTDLYWPQGSLRANRVLYALLVVLGTGGAVFVYRILMHSNTAGLHVAGLTPFTYFCTQCRVVWTYVRLFFLPFGQNADPDVAISHSLLEGGAIFGLAAWVVVAGAASFYRKRFPLGSFGIFVFLLLIAPTSSVIPIQDLLQERRVYLPFLGLALVCLEFLRRFEWKRRVMIEAPVLIVLLALTYQRSELWGDPLALWQDTVAKSPNKVRPRFQLAEVYYDQGKFPQAAENYEIAAHLGPPDYRLLVNYGLALDQTGRHAEALAKLQQAAAMERDPEVWTLIGQVYGEQGNTTEAMEALEHAERINPLFEMTYAIRGNVYESAGDLKDAEKEYEHALRIDPYNDAVRQALQRVQREAAPRRQ